MTHKTERGEDKPFGGISLAYREAHGLTPQKIAETIFIGIETYRYGLTDVVD